MKREARIMNVRGNKYQLVIDLDEIDNDKMVKVPGTRNGVYVDLVTDLRNSTDAQRKLFFALVNEVCDWSGNEPEAVKSFFYERFTARYGKPMSLKDGKTLLTDVNKLLNIVIEFIFENNVPINKAYPLLPKEQAYYLYACCKYRKCAVCGRHADIHHVDVLGMGMNREKVDHSKRHVLPLCRKHHGMIEQYGNKWFVKTFHVPVTGVKLSVETLKKIGVRGDYDLK